MKAALAQATPGRRELHGLLETMRTPSAKDRLRPAAVADIGRLRSRLHAARTDVKRTVGRSPARRDVLAFLADVDGVFAVIAELGESSDPKRARRLHARAVALEARAKAAAHRLEPWLGAR
jgi:hypothetical protein